MQLPIQTDRLYLRQFVDSDLSDVLQYSSNADHWLARNLPWPVTTEGILSFWQRHRDADPTSDLDWLCLVIEQKSEGIVIGHVDIAVFTHGDHRQGAVGWLLGRQHQGHGFATEAIRGLLSAGFEQLNLHRITARTGHDNRRSWYLMERVGMRREAHFKKSHRVNNRWGDEYIYAVLAEEWPPEHELSHNPDLSVQSSSSR